MKLKFEFKSLAIAVFLIVIMVSCIDLETEPVYYSDAFIVSRIIDNDTMYTIDAQVQCTRAISEATLKSEHLASPLEMKNIVFNSTIFEYTTPIENYSLDVPKAGNYNFDFILSDGTTYSEANVVKEKHLSPFALEEISYNSNEMSVVIDWPEVKDADYYNVRILRNTAIVFNTSLISKEFTSIKVSHVSPGWIGNYVASIGDSLSVSVLAILAEDVISTNFKIQSISFSNPAQFQWGD